MLLLYRVEEEPEHYFSFSKILRAVANWLVCSLNLGVPSLRVLLFKSMQSFMGLEGLILVWHDSVVASACLSRLLDNKDFSRSHKMRLAISIQGDLKLLSCLL